MISPHHQDLYTLYKKTREYRGSGCNLSEFAELVQQTVYEEEFGKRFALLLEDLKQVGYKTLYSGVRCEEAYYRDFSPRSDLLVARPDIKKEGWLPIWHCLEKYFPTSCGNSHSMFLTVTIPEKFRKVYEL